MQLATLDEITRRALLDNNLSIHFYFEYLNHAANCLRELTIDTLKIVNTVNLPVNSYGGVDLPQDFVDDVAVCLPAGNGLVSLPKQDWLTPLRLHDTTTGDFVPYNDNLDKQDANAVWGLPFGYNYYWNVDSYGQSTGGQFGVGEGTMTGYKLVKERRQIQMTHDLIGDNSNVVLMYISNGQSIDNASQIDYMAFACIRSYQDWKVSPNRNNVYSPEGRGFYNQKRVLRSRLNELTATDIRNVFLRSYIASPKN